jgi:hypothetical protein
MPIYTARVIRTIHSHYSATLTVEADSLDEACEHFEDLEELKAGKDYHESDSDETNYDDCIVDGEKVGDNWKDAPADDDDADVTVVAPNTKSEGYQTMHQDDIDNEAAIRAKLIAEMQANGTLLPKLAKGRQTLFARQTLIANWDGWTEAECRWSAEQVELRIRQGDSTDADPTAFIGARLRRGPPIVRD